MKNIYFLVIMNLLGTGLLAQNLVQNPGLENWDDPNTPALWDKIENISQETSDVYEGSFAARHTSDESTKDFQQDIDGIEGGTEYIIRYYFKDNDNMARTRIWSYWMNNGDYLDDQADILRPNVYSEDNPDWQVFEQQLQAPANANQFRFEVRVYRQDNVSGGYVIYDGFSLEKVSSDNPEPSEYPANFMAEVEGLSATLTWSDSEGENLPSGYFIHGELAIGSMSQNLPPIDGQPEADDLDPSDGILGLNVPYGQEMAVFPNLLPDEAWMFTIFPYANSGENIDYKTDGMPPTTFAETDAITILSQENFDDCETLGSWSQYSVVGDQLWENYSFNDECFARVSGYDGAPLINEDWLISPSLSTSGFDSVLVSFLSARNFDGEDLRFFISNEYNGNGNPNDFAWTELTNLFDWSVSDWEWVASGNVHIESFSGTNVHLAFQYISDESAAAAWEIDDILVLAYLSVGLDETYKNSAKVYPNPANGSFNVSGQKPITQLKIYQMNGQLIDLHTLHAPDVYIQADQLPAGLYILNINYSDGSIENHKLFIR